MCVQNLRICGGNVVWLDGYCRQEAMGDETEAGVGVGGWDKLKKTPATIVIDGLSINDYLSLLHHEILTLTTSHQEQDGIIKNLIQNLENEKNKNSELEQKLNELNEKLTPLLTSPTSANEIHQKLEQHENEIKELLSRPVVDMSESLRLSIVEKKLASFYGNDINILGRVCHSTSSLLHHHPPLSLSLLSHVYCNPFLSIGCSS